MEVKRLMKKLRRIANTLLLLSSLLLLVEVKEADEKAIQDTKRLTRKRYRTQRG